MEEKKELALPFDPWELPLIGVIIKNLDKEPLIGTKITPCGHKSKSFSPPRGNKPYLSYLLTELNDVIGTGIPLTVSF